MKTQTIKPLDPQKAFNKVWKHFIVDNGKPSKRGWMGCAYRDKNESTSKIRCSIGMLIPDKLYNRSFEAHTIGQLIKNQQKYGGILPVLFDKQEVSFWDGLQDCHDRAAYDTRSQKNSQN